MDSFLELQVAFALVIAVALIEKWRLRHAGPNLILQEFRVGSCEARGEFLYIIGRRAGVVAKLLGLFGLKSRTSFSATDDEVARETVGPSGFESLYSPLIEISGSNCSYYRAFWVLVLAAVIFLNGFATFIVAAFQSEDSVRKNAMTAASSTLWATLILVAASYAWYVLSKRVLISVRAKGGFGLGISLKPGILENQTVDLRKVIDAVDLLNARILAKKRKD